MKQGERKPISAGMSNKVFNNAMIVLGIVALLYVFFEWRHNRNLYELCARNGGYLVSGYEGWYCIKQENFITRKDAK